VNSFTSITASLEDIEIVQWVPPPRTIAEPLIEYSHSVSVLLAAQPSIAPTLLDIQLSTALMLTFSVETMALIAISTCLGDLPLEAANL